ncbi:MAG: hypothetical protein IKK09_08900 [Clostridia bacterium]|nr:hypothetical protein [Clostridia bacterium]
MTIRIRFYDNSSVLNDKYLICSKLRENFKESANNKNNTFLIEFFCISDDTLKKCIIQNDKIIFTDIDEANHYDIADDEFCYILVDLDWKNYAHIRDEVLNKYNVETNREKIKMLLYTHAATYSELTSNYEQMKKMYNHLQFFKAPTMILHNEHYVNKWCINAIEVFK